MQKPDQIQAQPQSGFLIVILTFLALATIFGSFWNQLSPGIYEKTSLVRGWDFQQFYLAGKLTYGDLYDIETFQSLQKSLLPIDEENLPFLPFYPPMTALAFQPFASLSYLQALSIWWVVCLVSYCGACWLLIQNVESRNRNLMLLVMAGFFPFFMAMRAGQLAPVLLLISVIGLKYRSGLVLSLLSLKPQFALGLAIYWIIKREWKLSIGMMIGLALQLVVVIGCIGPGIILKYLEMLPIYRIHADLFIFPHGWVHSMSGLIGRLPHGVIVVLLAVICALGGKKDWSVEASLSILFMLFFTPHLLFYDLLFLIIPITLLIPNWKLSLPLIATSSALALPIWAFGDVSLVPVLILGIILYHHWDEFWSKLRDIQIMVSPKRAQPV